MNKVLGLVTVVVCTSISLVLANEDDHWDTRFGTPGPDSLVFGMSCSGSDLYLTGSFTSAGESSCTGIAKWDGANWSGFGSGFSMGSVAVGLTVATRGAEVYVGGAFITNISGVPVRGVAKWDGHQWSNLGGGVNGIVYSLLFKGNDLFVGGIFSQAGGITASNIARWDGTNWHALDTGVSDSTNGLGTAIMQMALDWNEHLIVCGNFRHAGSVEANNVARWDGSQWHALGSGLFNGGPGLAVNALAVHQSQLYAAGVFKSASGVNATNLARWDGSQWHPMGGGPWGTNQALAFVGDTLYTAGNFTNIAGVAAKHVARWNGAAWEPLAPGTAGEILTKVSCLASDGVNLYAGGDFIQAGYAGVLGVAKWDGAKWSSLVGPKSQGLWLGPKVVWAAGNDVYVGGSGLYVAGGVKPNKIAHWNGSAWDDVGGGVTGPSADVNAIIREGGIVYVGGSFTNAGGVPARNVAYWDGASWHAMGSGLNNSVYALCFHNGTLFAGGSFTARYGASDTLPGIARWDGYDWVSVPIISSWRINNVVNSLISDGANLYMGGNYYIGWFEPTPPYNGASVENVGYWDGSRWWPLGTGLSNTVACLAFVGNDLYAGGSFTNSGAKLVRRLAKWNGSTWSEVGGGMTNGSVTTLAAKGSALLVGGSFTAIGGNASLCRFARWDGAQWSTLGSALSRKSSTTFSVTRIAVSGEDVYVVGVFNHAGGRPSAGIAHWNETVSFVPPTIQLLGLAKDNLGRFQFGLSGLDSGTFTVQATTNLINWSDIFSDSVPNTNFTDLDSPSMPMRIYRVKTP